MLVDERFRTNSARVANRELVDAAVGGWFAGKTREEALAHMRAAAADHYGAPYAVCRHPDPSQPPVLRTMIRPLLRRWPRCYCVLIQQYACWRPVANPCERRESTFTACRRSPFRRRALTSETSCCDTALLSFF